MLSALQCSFRVLFWRMSHGRTHTHTDRQTSWHLGLKLYKTHQGSKLGHSAVILCIVLLSWPCMYVVYSIRADLLQLLSVAFSGSRSTVGCRRIWGIVNTRSRGQHTQSSRPLTLAWGEDSRIIGDVSMEYKMHESFRQKKRNQLFVSLMTKIENVMCVTLY